MLSASPPLALDVSEREITDLFAGDAAREGEAQVLLSLQLELLLLALAMCS